ncbi:MAG TPA: HlyD family type I secretion periplasmic adaptor subunit [Methylomusa anaerophila]|uniref:Hemolysin secretion protein D, plasmid n=1 Tax=Methylomusa anaerophila TaxID=1930071 RepID=A0A348AIA5_9FIRM|nr:HlyD family type I secretion periplasmic adaptor subunit [Methylomusa anaerophila]BBB90803.1 hemolysin secretion protein D, plasmid [Methylomusa anaerophila]HML90540.1 HlyD family type I secretion periplasmic adaptor subunit [Methylomusa anaerophila]
MRLITFDWFKRLRKSIKSTQEKVAASEKLSKDELEFLPAALEVVQTPPSPVGRLTAWLLIALFSIAVVWSCVGHVDEVAIAQGKVIPSGYTKTIQAFDTGVVKAIHVKDGSKVQPGDVLIEMDTTFTTADFTRLLKEQAYYQLEIKRLIAEQTGQPFVPDPDSAFNPQDLLFQLQYYRSRMAEYQAKAATAQQAVNQAQAAIETAQAAKQKLTLQLEIAIDKESKMEKLTEVGAVGQFQYLDYKEKRNNIQQDLVSQTSDIAKANYALLQSIESLNNIVSERENDIMSKLVESRHQLQAVEEELRKAEEKDRRSTVTSPIAGTVQQLAVHTVGGVVTPAQALMLVVPEDAQMEIEAWVANKDIGFVYGGQNAEIKVETFNFQKYGTLDATLVEISSDAVDDKDKGLVYRALFRTNLNYFSLANDRTVYLSPGMAVIAEIKTRKKRIIEYFMDPFIKYRSEGLRER